MVIDTIITCLQQPLQTINKLAESIKAMRAHPTPLPMHQPLSLSLVIIQVPPILQGTVPHPHTAIEGFLEQ